MKRALLAVLLLLVSAGFAQAQGAPGSVTWTGTPHGNALTWTASATAGVTYNLYRGTVSGGPYAKVNTAPIATLTFTDLNSNLTVSTQYFYVATAVDSNGNESAYSNQASVVTPTTFPANPQAPSGLAGANK